MANRTIQRPGYCWKPYCWAGIALTLCGVGQVNRGYGQTPQADPPTVGGLEGELPNLPLKSPRPLEGPGVGERWQATRDARDRAPIASFIDSLRGNDAAFEVIVGQGRLLTLKEDRGNRAQDGPRPAAGPRRRSLPLPASASNRPYRAMSADRRRMGRRRGDFMRWDNRRPEWAAAAFATKQPVPSRESSICCGFRASIRCCSRFASRS